MTLEITLRPYGKDDFFLLERTLGDAAMMTYQGQVESIETLRKRHTELTGDEPQPFGNRTFVILANEVPAGTVGYWETEHHGEPVWETGWFVMTPFQNRGIATQALLALLEVARADGKRRIIYAYARIDNLASNAVCRKAGFELEGMDEFESSPGVLMPYNSWRFPLA